MSKTRATTFALGVASAVAAVLPPLDGLAHRSFAAHMAQHLVLLLVTPILIVASKPGAPIFRALPAPLRRRPGALVGRLRRTLATRPAPLALGVFAAHAAVMWLWHAPPPFEAALRSPPIHALEHATLLGTALCFWAVAANLSSRRRVGGAWYAFGTAVHSGLLAALITFSPSPWYAAYGGDLPWGLTALEDQQLAGVLMWVPAGIAYTGAGLALFAKWLTQTGDQVVARSVAQATNASRSSPRSSAM